MSITWTADQPRNSASSIDGDRGSIAGHILRGNLREWGGKHVSECRWWQLTGGWRLNISSVIVHVTSDLARSIALLSSGAYAVYVGEVAPCGSFGIMLMISNAGPGI